MSELEKEIERLKSKGLSRICAQRDLSQIALLTLEINKLKKQRNAVIPVHVYQRPEIIVGVADFVGDSYKLAKDCVDVNSDVIIFCGVKFMAETAKILNPQKRVFIPDVKAGCSLSDSITANDILKLKEKYPDVPVVTYINTSAEVKAVSDIIVTSSSALKILSKLFEKYKRIIFVPDKYMGANLAKILNKKIGEDIILWDGSCIVHEKFDSSIIKDYRKKYPSMLVLAHSECPSEIIKEVDFMGSTSDMLKFVETTNAQIYMLITECGLGEFAVTKFPNKNFIAMCRLCPYMKMITLENILDTLKYLPPESEINIKDDIIKKAQNSLNKMFEISQL
ncbi:MAG: quinolinate synthase NadA [Elusimicrobiales bacterium]|nr:quinolinate synthase NadA [Elusimicrobiales bacterium]